MNFSSGDDLNFSGEIVHPFPPKWSRCNFKFKATSVTCNTSCVYMNVNSNTRFGYKILIVLRAWKILLSIPWFENFLSVISDSWLLCGTHFNSLKLLPYLFMLSFPLKISHGAAEDIRSLVKQRYILLEYFAKLVFLSLFWIANLSCFMFNWSVTLCQIIWLVLQWLISAKWQFAVLLISFSLSGFMGLDIVRHNIWYH